MTTYGTHINLVNNFTFISENYRSQTEKKHISFYIYKISVL